MIGVKHNMKRKILSMSAVVCMLLISACGNTASSEYATTSSISDNQTEQTEQSEQSDQVSIEEASNELFAMDTYMTVTAYGENAQEAVDAASAEIERLDALLSTGDENSEIAQINLNHGGTLSADTSYLVESALDLYHSTDGAFDIAIYPIMQAWGFPTQEYAVPSEDVLESLFPLTDADNIVFDQDNSQLSFAVEGMEIDLGGIAKGYTSSRIMDIYREYGIVSGMVNLGGNVQVYSTKTDGSLWRIAVQSPDDSDDYVGILEASDVAVITSGGYERYFEEDGQTYHHIIDPDTGYPADNGLVSVTIVSADGTLADALSTSLFIMGKERAEQYWRAHSDDFDMILMDEDGILYVSEGIEENFTSDYTVEIVREEN
jgi:thiamine biosynthesis lipoprotein